MTNITYVTALYDIGRGDLDGGFSRSFDHYLETFDKLLKLDINLLIYCDQSLNSFIDSRRKQSNTRIVNRSLDELKQSTPQFDKIQKIRNSDSWKHQAGWLSDSTQAKLEFYNPLVMSKQFMLNDATLFNFFNTEYFVWVDAGIFNTVSLCNYINDPTFEKKLTTYLNKMLYLCFPYDGTVEVHGFSKNKLNEYAGHDTSHVARGGFFGGKKETINEINHLYYWLMNDTLTSGYMGTEESIFTIISYKHADLCNIQMIESNGLIYSFFDRVMKTKINQEEELAIYCLTYNLPKQFKLFAEAFKKSNDKSYNKIKKYVINNSTDPATEDEYTNLFKEYEFIEFKQNNIGINGGRHYAANHFYNSDHKYMIFFEDDMLLHNDPSVRCKMGFTTYHFDLFNKAIHILETEKLDYLKLAFSEFYGDSHNDWAWHNVPKKLKDEYFPSRLDGVCNWKTKIDYTGSYKGLPYAVGHYHYCNWPILFTKSGTKKIFLDTIYEHKYEQTWMSLCKTLQMEGKIKCGCLLATTINHNRVHHYTTKRKENEFS